MIFQFGIFHLRMFVEGGGNTNSQARRLRSFGAISALHEVTERSPNSSEVDANTGWGCLRPDTVIRREVRVRRTQGRRRRAPRFRETVWSGNHRLSAVLSNRPIYSVHDTLPQAHVAISLPLMRPIGASWRRLPMPGVLVTSARRNEARTAG
jgi:hypothetical protein